MKNNLEFERDVREGLSRKEKRLFSKYFYDEEGDKIFQEIMALDEYYLPEAELEILQTKAREIIAYFPYDQFDIIELGAGDGTKTVHFLSEILGMGRKIAYYPIDISPDILRVNRDNMKAKLPQLEVHEIAGDYFNNLHKLKTHSPKIILFMGGNLGNYKNEEAINFLKLVGDNMQPGDLLIVGIDLRKNPKTILKAYSDSSGVTKRFNLNILKRINRELHGNFDLSNFDHYPYYNPVDGIAYSYIVSLKDQTINIQDYQVHLKRDELIQTEVSQKYSLEEIERLKDHSGFHSIHHILDHRGYFSLSIFSK